MRTQFVQQPHYRADLEPPPHPKPEYLDFCEMYSSIHGPEGMIDNWDPSPHAKIWKGQQLDRARNDALQYLIRFSSNLHVTMPIQD